MTEENNNVCKSFINEELSSKGTVNFRCEHAHWQQYEIYSLDTIIAYKTLVDDKTEIFIREYAFPNESSKSIIIKSYTDLLKSYIETETKKLYYIINVPPAIEKIKFKDINSCSQFIRYMNQKKTDDQDIINDIYTKTRQQVRDDRIVKQYLSDIKNATIFPAVIEDIFKGYM
jgi:hypothetical protein